MSKAYDFKKEWETIKKNLKIYGDEAFKLAKKGEKEMIRISKEGKLRFDSAALNLKQEQLYYMIGKEYMKAKCPGSKNAKLKKLIDEFQKAGKEKKTLDKKINKSEKK
ncbi:MAG: hypothetical protein ABIJ41_00110 [Candidatus Omnitrophota bacterium]